MTRYVIGPDVATRLAHERAVISDEHRILAPTLLRSHVLSSLYQAVQRGELTRKDAEERLDYIRGLRIRLLGDRVLQSVAWKIADKLGWPDTFDAEYVALTQLQADAFVTLDQRLARAVGARHGCSDRGAPFTDAIERRLAAASSRSKCPRRIHAAQEAAAMRRRRCKRGCQRAPAQPSEPGRQRCHHLLQPRTGSATFVDG
jgi:predicted nucleic acid-binding protein